MTSSSLVPWGGGGGLRAPGGERPGTAHAEAVRRRAEARKRFSKTIPAGKLVGKKVPLRPTRRLPNVTPAKSVIDERLSLAAQHYRDMVSNFAKVYNSLKREREAKCAHMEELAAEILELDLQVDFNEGLADRKSTPNLYCAMLLKKMQDLDVKEAEALVAHNGLNLILARVLKAPVLVLKQQASFNQRVFKDGGTAEKAEPGLVPAASPRADKLSEEDRNHEGDSAVPQKSGLFRKKKGASGGRGGFFGRR